MRNFIANHYIKIVGYSDSGKEIYIIPVKYSLTEKKKEKAIDELFNAFYERHSKGTRQQAYMTFKKYSEYYRNDELFYERFDKKQVQLTSKSWSNINDAKNTIICHSV